MQGVIIMFVLQLGLIIGLSALFCSLYMFVQFYKENDDIEDDYGYLEKLMDEEVKI